MSRKGGWYDERDDYYDEYDDEDEDEDYYDEDDDAYDVRVSAPVSTTKKTTTTTTTAKVMSTAPKERAVGGKELKARSRAVANAKYPATANANASERTFGFDTPSPDASALASRQRGGESGSTSERRGTNGGGATTRGTDADALAKQFAEKTRVDGGATGGISFVGYEPTAAEREAYGRESADVHAVILGHVDAGKSTLSGRLLYALKAVDDRAVHKNARDARASGKASFAWAWVMDSRPEERERGVTIDVSVKRCVLDEGRNLVILDAPGHRDFVPSAISGVSQADVGVLVIDGAVGGFENGFEATPGHTGQTREHARLAKSLGLRALIVAINKLDTVEYDSGRFEYVVDVLRSFLVGDIGFEDGQLLFVPVSGIEGVNIVTDDTPSPPGFAWYKGPTLVDALRSIHIPPRGDPKPFRMPIADIVTEVRSLGSAACGGKIESGSLQKGQQIVLMPANVKATVKTIEVDGLSVDFAPIGTTVDVGLTGIDPIHLQVGSVLCHVDYPMIPANEIEVRVLTTDVLRVPLLKGSKVILHSHMLACDATVTELIAQVDTLTGDVLKANPRCITREQSAVLRVKTSKNVCVEPAEVSPTLSKIALRMGGKTMALGVVTAVWR
jgi:elongation factor 1 alpha-like protein